MFTVYSAVCVDYRSSFKINTTVKKRIVLQKAQTELYGGNTMLHLSSNETISLLRYVIQTYTSVGASTIISHEWHELLIEVIHNSLMTNTTQSEATTDQNQLQENDGGVVYLENPVGEVPPDALILTNFTEDIANAQQITTKKRAPRTQSRICPSKQRVVCNSW